METETSETIDCHFCGNPVPYPVEIGLSYTCPHCKCLYTAELEGDEHESICDFYSELTGDGFEIRPEKIEEKIETYVQHQVDALYESEEKAEKYPEDGIQVFLVWARLRSKTAG